MLTSRPPVIRMHTTKRPAALTLFLFAIAVLAGTALRSTAGPGRYGAAQATPAIHEASPSEAARVSEAYGRLPLSFEINQGQTDPRVRFIARGPGYETFLTATGAVLALHGGAATDGEARPGRSIGTQSSPAYRVLRMSFAGADANAQSSAFEELPGKYNYFVGSDTARWRRDVPVYARAEFRGVYDGIDLVYYGNQRQLEYDFRVAPGADPRVIKLLFDGIDSVKVNGEGSLVLKVGGGEVCMHRPTIYQTTEDGSRREVAGRYMLSGRRVVGFKVGDYDRRRPLVIDPVLSYSTYLQQAGSAIAVGPDGSAYVTGGAGLLSFPATGHTFTSGDGGAVITKLDPSGSALVYSTLVGGNNSEQGSAIALDSAGGAYITGQTTSTDFPTVNGVRVSANLLKSTDGGGNWAASNDGLGGLPVYALAVDPSDASTLYAGTDGGSGVYKSTNGGATWEALTKSGAAYVTCLAVDPRNPSTIYAGALSAPLHYNVRQAYIIKSTDGGASWVQLNGGFGGVPSAVDSLAVDPVTPSTVYAGTYNGLYKTTDGGASWVFVTGKYTSSVAIDPLNPATIYILSGGGVFKTTDGGATWNPKNSGLPATPLNSLVLDPTNPSILYVATSGSGVFQSGDGAENWGAINAGLSTPYVSLLTVTPGTLYAGTNLGIFKTTGGSSWKLVYGKLASTTLNALAVGAASTVYAGLNLNANSTSDPEAFVVRLNPAGDTIVYSTYLGGIGIDEGVGIAVNSAGQAYVAGTTTSGDFPLAAPRQATFGGGVDAFVTKFAAGGGLLYSTYLGGSSDDFAGGVAVDAGGNAYVVGRTVSTDFPTTPGAFQKTLSGPPQDFFDNDAFVTKLDPTGATLVYSTYLGGKSGSENGSAIAVDPLGNAYVAGTTRSPEFPLLNPVPACTGGGRSHADAFVTKLNPAGSGLVYSTCLGGSDGGYALGLAVTPGGDAVVVGATNSNDFPVTADALPVAGGTSDTQQGFVTRLNAAGTDFVYSTYLGGRGAGAITSVVGVAADTAGNAYVTGVTRASDFPVTPGAFQTFLVGDSDAFVTKIEETIRVGGMVSDGGGAPLSGVRVTLSGDELRAAMTGADGRYSFVNLPRGGNYTVSASKSGFVFTPPSRAFDNLSADVTADFVASVSGSPFYVITGRVAEASGAPVADVVVRLSGALIDFKLTDAAGNYLFKVPAGGDYTLTPTAYGLTFDPPARTFASLGADATADFTAARHDLLVSNTEDSGRGSLRQAIAEANSTPGRDRIIFNIPGPGVKTISPTAPLPDLTGPTVLDARTQPGYAGTPLVELDGGRLPGGHFDGLRLTGAGGVVRGLAVFGFDGASGVSLVGDDNAVEACYLGLDAAGHVRDRLNRTGVTVAGANNRVGGYTPAERNLISGNGSEGVAVYGAGNRVVGNFVGTDASGLGSAINPVGVLAQGPNTLVGGVEPGARNVISNNHTGIKCSGGDAVIRGNLIGTDPTGDSRVGNGIGIDITSGNNMIGGAEPGARNVISGNGTGVRLAGTGMSATGNVLRGNLIGTNAAGDAPLPNSTGVRLSDFSNGASGNQIGGDSEGAGNVIAFNYAGIVLWNFASRNNVISGNSIFSNTQSGIDLNTDEAVTFNDPLDADAGPNNLQNFPQLTSVSSSGGTTRVVGVLDSTPGKQFRLDFYSNLACDDSGYGEGGRPFGSASVTTDASGKAVIDVTLPRPLPPGRALTATATDPAGNTSEFSRCDASKTAGSVEYELADLSALEDVGSVTVKVVRRGGSVGAMTVNYASADGTATAGSDYVAVSGKLTFAPGETSRTFALPIIANEVFERDKTVRLTLSTPDGPEALGAQAAATLHILDATTALDIRTELSGGRLVEGDSGRHEVAVRLTLGAATSRAVSVDFSTSDVQGGATAGVDYVPVSGTVSFPPGTQTRDILLPIVGDTLYEGPEYIGLTLTNGVNVVLPSLRPSIIISDDDPPPALSVAGLTVVERAGAKALINVRLSSASGQSVTVDYATANGTAVAGSDYALVSGRLVFAPGETIKTVEVPVLSDSTPESDETFLLRLTNPAGAFLALPEGAVTITESSAASLIQFSSVAYSVSESDHFADITVTRSGDLSGEATVSYETSGQTASERADFTSSLGRLRLAPGEASKNFRVLITDDAFKEPDESLDLLLASPSGATLGSPSVAALTIVSDDAADGPSPFRVGNLDPSLFVRQHYADFLSREPDADGLRFWTNEIEQCGADAQCREVKRINVSAAFFLSIEFQETGFYVYRMYKAAYGDINPPAVPVPVRLREFLADSQEVGQGVQVGVGPWRRQLEDHRNAFADDFVSRTRFAEAYPQSLTAEEFVRRLNANSGAVLSPSEFDALARDLSSGAKTRAQVLRAVAEDPDLIRSEMNRAFVLMQYFGYLRRDPDAAPDTDFAGYNFWLAKLDQFGGNFVQAEMVKAFLDSAEYNDRFGN